MQTNLTLHRLLRLLDRLRPSYTLFSATVVLAGTLSLQAQSSRATMKEMDGYTPIEQQPSAITPSPSGSGEFGSDRDAYAQFSNGYITKDVDADAETHPVTSVGTEGSFIYGGNDNHDSATAQGDYVGNTNITTSGGYASVIIGGNYGNAQGASFTGDTHVSISTDTFVDIGGASYLTHDVTSKFDGNTYVSVTEVLQYSTGEQTVNWSMGAGTVAGGHIGGLFTGESDGTPRENIITGNTQVSVDLAGKSGVFEKLVTGGSALFGGIDVTTQGSSTLSISNAQGITFTDFIAGGGFSYSKAGSSKPAENSGTNKSDISVASSHLNIDSGTYNQAVMGGGFSASGGDITTGNISVNVTGGTFNSYIIGGNGVGNTVSGSGTSQTDHSVGKVVSQDVTMNISNADTNSAVTGGHLIGGPSTYDSTEASSIGNITVNVGGYDEAGKALGGSYSSIYGGSILLSASSATFSQGDVAVNLETGSLKDGSTISAAGHVSNADASGVGTAVTTKSTTVKIGQDMDFGTGINVTGAYTGASNSIAGLAKVTGTKLLHFDDESYSNLGETTFHRFDEVRVDQASAHAQLEGNTVITTLDADYLTKSGAGTLSVEAGMGRGTVDVVAGRMNITTDKADSTVGTLKIESGATASSDSITLARDEVAGTGLSVNEITGKGTLMAKQVDVKQQWQEQGLEVYAEQQFRMTTGGDVHLEALTTAQLHMEDSGQLYTEGLLNVTSIHIDDYLANGAASTPYITSHDIVNENGNSFTFDFSAETIANMNLNPSMTPYLLADLSDYALETATDKYFTFQIDGQGDSFYQVLGETTYFISTIDEDVYISAVNGGSAIPEPATTTLSLLALAGLLARRRRR